MVLEVLGVSGLVGEWREALEAWRTRRPLQTLQETTADAHITLYCRVGEKQYVKSSRSKFTADEKYPDDRDRRLYYPTGEE